MAENLYNIVGRVISVDDKQGIPGLRVEAWDKDLIFHDLVGSTYTGYMGSFSMTFDSSAFKELFLDRHPDLFFKVFKGSTLIKSTRDAVLWNVASGETEVVIEVDLSRKPKDEPVVPDPDRWPEREPEGEVPGEQIHPPEHGKWKDEIHKWWKDRQKERQDEEDEDRLPMPRPYVDCTSHFGPHVLPLRVDEPGTVSFTVWNDGNFPAWTCYVQIYEGPTGYSHPLSDYELRGQKIITLQPGERRDIPLPWVRRQQTGRIVGICFDPILDPKDFTLVEQRNRHITSVHYLNLE